MKKLIFSIAIIIILLLTVVTNGLELSILNKEKTIKKSNLDVNTIIPKNDAYHGIKNYPSYEWWYFDAVFDDNYGIHVGIRVLSFRKWGLVHQLVNIYNNSKLEEKVVITKPLRDFQISEEFPDIKYKNKPLLKFDYDEYNVSGNWNYTISFELGSIKLNLTFVGKSEGFTYVTSHEGWTVAQPIADVFGTIHIDENERHVTGIGYHDHNWNFSLKTSIRATGWYWGKIISTNYSLTWAKIKKTRFADDTIVENLGILSILNDGFIGIDPGKIDFLSSNYIFHTARFIPTKFSLYAKHDELEINVTFDTIDIQHTEPDFLTINYWRYFVSINGYIKIGENIDYLENDIEIMEFIRFI
jgi:predicted secreted hydrolase